MGLKRKESEHRHNSTHAGTADGEAIQMDETAIHNVLLGTTC